VTKNFLLSLLLVFTNLLFGQQYSFLNYGVKDGLAQSQVTDICQDKLGYLWIGTQSGLSKFDGESFLNYSMDNGLADNTIHKLLFDSLTNTLWIATPRGLSTFINGEFNSYLFEKPQKTNDIIIRNGELLLATNNGIVAFKDNLFSYVENDLKIRQFAVNKNDSIICATQSGLFLFDSVDFKDFGDSLLLNKNYSGITIKNNVYTLSTYGQGVFKYNEDTEEITPYNIEYQKTRGSYVFQGETWIFGNFGLIQLDKNLRTTYYSEQNGLPINSIKCVFVDNEKNVWIGTYGKGLLKFSSKSIISYSVKDDLASDIVMSVYQNNNTYLFGTYDKGVSLFKKNIITKYNVSNGLNHNSIWAISSLGDKFVIGSTSGINYLHGGLIENEQNISGKIRTIFKQNDSVIFIGGKNGLWRIENNLCNQLLNDSRYDINKVVINESKIYLATKTGLYWQNLNKLNEEFIKIQLPEENCNSITLDHHKNIWVGTVNGLFVVSPKNQITSFNLDEDNFKSKNVMGIIKDSKNLIWISTTNGVYLIESKNPFYSRPVQYHYSNAQGLIDLECNLNSIYEDSDGLIWVGTSSALVSIDPNLNASLFNYKLPQLSIRDIRLFKEKFDYKSYSKMINDQTNLPNELVLPHTKNHLTFNFIGINYKNPKKVMYSYRLLGAEDDWSPLSNETSATYSFITPGEYEFQVKSTNDNYNWTDIQNIKVVIKPPFWKTWWFISLIAFGMIGIVYTIFIFRINTVKRINDNKQLQDKSRLRELEQQSLNASMNRHFIFNSLNSIQYFINSSDKLSANRFLSNFAKLIRKNLDSSTSDNFIVNLEEEIERITLYLKLEKMRFGEKFDYEINIDDTIDLETVNVPSMILQPFIENSIIHGVLPKSTKGLITLNIKSELDSVVFEVIDDGVGIDDSLGVKTEFSGDHESKGMMITTNRIELIRKINGGKLLIIGPFQINNKNGDSNGTKVIIKIPTNTNL
jgi:ligand-binding sensor domain-containing protein